MPWPKGKPFSPEHLAKRVASFKHNGVKRKVPIFINGVECWCCSTCNKTLDPSNFYSSSKYSNGLSSSCRKCHMQTSIRTRNKEKARRNSREYMRRARKTNPERFRERERVASSKRQKTIKTFARQILNEAVKKGIIIKPAECELCNKKRKLTGHHHDYIKPLEVKWLCYECHGTEHRK